MKKGKKDSITIPALAEKIVDFCQKRKFIKTWNLLSSESCEKSNSMWEKLAGASFRKKSCIKIYKRRYYWTFQRHFEEIKKIVNHKLHDRDKTNITNDSSTLKPDPFFVESDTGFSLTGNDSQDMENNVETYFFEDLSPPRDDFSDTEEPVSFPSVNGQNLQEKIKSPVGIKEEKKNRPSVILEPRDSLLKSDISMSKNEKVSAYKLLEDSSINSDNHSSRNKNSLKKQNTEKSEVTIIIPRKFWENYWDNGPKLKNNSKVGDWHDELQELFATQFPMCSLAFDYHVCHPSPARISTPCFSARGHCQFLNCSKYSFHVHAKIFEPYQDLPCKITKYGNTNHEKGETHRRPIRQWRRKQLQEELRGSTPYKIETRMINSVSTETLESGNLNNVVDKQILQKISSEKNLEKRIDKDLCSSLLKLCDYYKLLKPGEYAAGFIQSVTLTPLSIILFTEAQLKYLKKLNLNDRLLYIDATGSLVSKPPWITKPIFNYRIVLAGSKDLSALTITEWISSNQTVSAVSGWINTFIFSFRKICDSWHVIKKIEMDFSLTLLHAVCNEINQITLWQYLQDRFDEETGKVAHKVFTILHICSSHTVKTVARKMPDVYPMNLIQNTPDDDNTETITKDEKKNKLRDFKNLVLGVMNLLIHCETLECAGEICRNIMIVFGLPYQAEGFAEAFKCLTRSDNIPRDSEEYHEEKEAINSNNNDETTENIYHSSTNDTDNIRGIKDSAFYIYLNKIREDVEFNTIVTDVDNKYYSEKLINYWFDFMFPFLPLWSCIVLIRLGMRRDSDAVIENNWNLLKTNIFEGQKNQSLPLYIQGIEPYINADINRRLFRIQGVNNKQEKVHKLDMTSYTEEKWVRGNFHFKGPKRLTKSIGIQTDNDSIMIHDNMSDDEDDKIEDVHEQNETSNESYFCEDKCMSTEELGLSPVDSLESLVCHDMGPDILNDLNIFHDYPNYPKNFPHLQEARICGIVIDGHSWGKLKPDTRINDTIINAFMMYMCDIAKTSFGLNVLPLDSFFAETLLTGLSEGYQKQLWSSAIWDHHICLIPINSSKIHWSLLVISPIEKIFIYLDSLHWDPDSQFLDKICAALEWTLTKKPTSQKLKWAEWTLFIPTDNPTQTFGDSTNNCGAHVCAWIYTICTGSRIAFDESHMPTVRKAIATILNGKIIKKSSRHLPHEQLPKFKKKSRTFDKMERKSTPPEGHLSTLDYCSSLIYSLVEHEPPSSNESIIHEDTPSFKEDQYKEDKASEDANCEEKIENIKSNKEETYESISCCNAVSSNNIFEDRDDYPNNFFNQELELFGIELILKRLQSLNGITYIDDSIIDVFLLLLQHHAEKTRNLRVLPFPAFMVRSIMDAGCQMNYVGWGGEADIWKQQIWILPVNLNNTHWVLLVVIPSRHEMIYFDSLLGEIPTNLVRGIFLFMETIPNNTERLCKNKKINWKEWVIFQPPDVPRQVPANGHCGAHLMSWAYVLCTSMIFKFAERDMPSVRKGVAKILSESITTDDQAATLISLTEKMFAEPRTKLDHKSKKFENVKIVKSRPAGCDTVTHIAMMAFSLFDNC